MARGQRRAKAILGAVLIALTVGAYAVLTVTYGLAPTEAGAAAAAVGVLGLVEVVLDRSSF